MNVKTTVVLLILLIVGLGYVIVFHTDWLARKGQPPAVTAEDKFLLSKLGKVERLEVERPGSARLVLARSDDKWRLVEPVSAPALAWQVNSLVSRLSGLRFLRKDAPDQPDFPKDDLTHLSAPLATVSLTDEKGQTYNLRVGRKLSISKNTYVQLDGDEHVYVVEADVAELLAKTANDYRETRVAQFATDQAVRLDVRGRQSYQLVKVGQKWSIDRPVSARADQGKVSSLLSDVSNITAEKFVNDAPTAADLAGYGLDQPRLAVTVALAPPTTQPASAHATSQPATAPAGEAKVIAVLFGNVAEKKAFAKLGDQPWVFQVGESTLKDLQPELAELRDKSVLELEGREISRLELSPPDNPGCVLEKSDDQWNMLTPFAGVCDQDAAGKLAAALKDLKAQEFVDSPATLAGFGLAPPAGTIVLHFQGSDKTTTLLIGRKSESGQTGFVRDAAGTSVAVIKAADYAELSRPAANYWTRQISELPAGAEVTQVELDRPTGSFTIQKGEGEKYKLTRPVAAPADEDNFKDLLSAVREVKADQVVSVAADLPQRFAKSKPIRVTLTYRVEVATSQPTTATAPSTRPATQAATHPTTAPATRPAPQYRSGQLTLAAAKEEGKSYVWRPGAKPLAVGELGGDFYDKLDAELRDRSVVHIQADQATGLTLVGPKGTLDFARAGEEWRYSPDAFVKIDGGKLTDFLGELGRLKAVRFAEYGEKADLKRFGLDKPAITVTVKTAEPKPLRLIVSATGPAGTKDRYAAGGDVPGVFVLSAGDVAKMEKTLADFKKD